MGKGVKLSAHFVTVEKAIPNLLIAVSRNNFSQIHLTLRNRRFSSEESRDTLNKFDTISRMYVQYSTLEANLIILGNEH